ncbi:MAG: hypothetical protein JAY90_19645 [Candidatus Thiodiazotropha lotti]|nr:hypothetical protein [Candidatus Thiodiazotropha lotti]
MITAIAKRPLGTVYWLEVPVIIMMSVLLAFVVGLVLQNNGMPGEKIGQLKMIMVFVGNLVAGGYIWLVSKNTSREIYTWLARGSVLMVVGLWIALLLKKYS